VKNYVVLTAALVVAAATFAVAGVHTVGGGGGVGNTIPWWGNSSSFPQMRFQTIWLSSQISESGVVTKLEHQDYSTSSTGGTFNGCLVKLCHTGLTAVTAVFANNYGGNTPVTVVSGTVVVPDVSSGQWWTLFSSSSTFTYNNARNLLYEVSWTTRSGGPNYINHTRSGQPGRVYASSATASSGSVTSGYGTVARITIEPTSVKPTSLGRVKAMYE
jgi:hypothetical protein